MSIKTNILNIIVAIFIIFASAIYIIKNQETIKHLFNNISSFSTMVENKTFDIRQRFHLKNKTVNEEIIVIGIDEKSYSELSTRFGEWPVPRGIYSDVLEYIEQANPKAIAIDLLFVASMHNRGNEDIKLAKTLAKYNNIFTAINFDNTLSENNTQLPERLEVNIINNSKINFNYNYSFSNVRLLIKEIMNSNANLGHINIAPDEDGTIRYYEPFAFYQNKIYPNLSLHLASSLFAENSKELLIDNSKNLILGNKKIPLSKNGGIILNWKPMPEIISFSKVYNASLNNDKFNQIFKDKIILIAPTALALGDLKNVAGAHNLQPGIAVHVSFLDNLYKNDFIKETSSICNVIINSILILLLSFSLLKIKRPILNLLILSIMITGYIFITDYIMQNYNIWLPLFLPIVLMIISFTIIYVIKYFIIAKDFEYTYKLATTDGLTELYNHRFFQEQLVFNIATAKRYNAEFSLLIIDIDFFKKFNDKFGHQAGDEVLRQVAKILKKNVRSADLVCRYGGEEMTIILPNTNKDDAILTAQKICKTIAETPFKLNPTVTQNVTISLGVATYPQNGTVPNELIEHADKGLYKAKENGRNQVGLAD